MGKAIFTDKDERVTELEVDAGTSLMRAATEHGIDGIVGECGGQLGCGTCHVLVEPAFLEKLPSPSDNEDQMLECTSAPRESNSRLSCQIIMSDDLDGIRVRVADTQL